MMSMNFILKGRIGKRSWTLNLVSRTLVLAEEMTEDEAEAAEVDAEIEEVEAIDVVVIAKVDVEDLVESHVEKVLKLLTWTTKCPFPLLAKEFNLSQENQK